MNNTKHTGVRIDENAHKKLKYVAKCEGRSINRQILYIIKKAIREFEAEHGTIETEEK